MFKQQLILFGLFSRCFGKVQPPEMKFDPVIGVVVQEIPDDGDDVQKSLYGKYSSFIAASYVKFIEGSSGRVLPVWIGQPRSYYEKIVNQTNGLLFPGGQASFRQSKGYADAAVTLFGLAVEANKRGNYYPIWGTCLGMELLLFASAMKREHRKRCSLHKKALPLQFINHRGTWPFSLFSGGMMFRDASWKVMHILKHKRVTFNSHNYCITRENMTKFRLDKEWIIYSVNEDSTGVEFVSSIESKTYPFYGVQFHPEKNMYEWASTHGIPHTEDAILVGQYFANFFMSEARRNSNEFKRDRELRKSLIYNYNPIYSGLNKTGSVFVQMYLF